MLLLSKGNVPQYAGSRFLNDKRGGFATSLSGGTPLWRNAVSRLGRKRHYRRDVQGVWPRRPPSPEPPLPPLKPSVHRASATVRGSIMSSSPPAPPASDPPRWRPRRRPDSPAPWRWKAAAARPGRRSLSRSGVAPSARRSRTKCPRALAR